MQKRCLCVYSRGFRQIMLSATKAFLRLSTLKILKNKIVYILNSAFFDRRHLQSARFYA